MTSTKSQRMLVSASRKRRREARSSGQNGAAYASSKAPKKAPFPSSAFARSAGCVSPQSYAALT